MVAPRQQLKSTPIGYLESLKFLKNPSRFIGKNYQHGDFYPLKIPFTDLHVVTSAELLQHILVTEEKKYEKSKIYWKQLKAIVGNALGTLEGEDWVWLKRLQKPFYTRQAVEKYLPTVLQLNDQSFKGWAQKEEIDLIPAFAQMNIAAILKVIFGVEQTEDCSTIASYIADGEAIIAWRSKLPWRPYTARFTHMHQRTLRYLGFFNAYTKKIIKPKLTKKTIDDLLDRLIEHSTFKGKDKFQLEDIRNEVIIHLGASTETAAVAEGWTLYLLDRHPEYKKRIFEEINMVTSGNPIGPEHYKQLKWTLFAVKEAMRLYPPSHAIIRDAVEDDKLQGKSIRKGTAMFISAYGLHRNPKYWPEPNCFRPERFEKEADFVKYSYIPFGAGRHTCIGRYLALPQIVLSIATFLQRFDYEFIDKSKINPESYATLKPDKPLNVRLKPKKKLPFNNQNS